MKSTVNRRAWLSALVGVLAASLIWVDARQQGSGDTVQLDPDDIGGVVTSPNGPEAGVWVIAETTDLPTRYAKVVVTDERGRYLLPDLPEAAYQVWVRGYGLTDSTAVSATPGQRQNLTAVPAPSPRMAAEIYPASYWYSLAQIPAKSEFPGTGPTGNGILRTMRTQADWINQMKEGCQICHQVGTKATREIPPNLTGFDSAVAAWDRRVQSGQKGAQMSNVMTRFGRQRGLEMFAEWSDRIAAGEVPEAPPRPRGVERNLVLTLWDWNGPTGFIHDNIASDKHDPTVNANGGIYGVEQYNGSLVVLDPVTHTTETIPLPTRESVEPYVPQSTLAPSPYWGEELIWTGTSNPHNPMVDHEGRIWMTSTIREDRNPTFCYDGSLNKFAEYAPLEQSGRQASYYDPETKRIELIDTCFSTHHLQFADDADRTLFFGGDSNAIGWLNTRVYDETGDAQQAQGWCPSILDTNGDGTITEWTEPSQADDPTKDKRINGFPYGINVSPVDNSLWWPRYTVPGGIVRLELGANPPDTCRAELYTPPYYHPQYPGTVIFNPRGLDIDSNGVVWVAFGGSGHLARFDRRQCTVFNGPETADGQHCMEGWTFYRTPGPNFKGATDEGSTDWHYLAFVDRFDTLGLGKDVPLINGSASDSVLAFDTESQEFVILRVPYPVGFYSRSVDGRIDDPNAGWKGRGLWSAYATTAVWHLEGGKGTQGKVVKFQIRPEPLAR